MDWSSCDQTGGVQCVLIDSIKDGCSYHSVTQNVWIWEGGVGLVIDKLLANEHVVPQIILHLEKLYDQDLQQ